MVITGTLDTVIQQNIVNLLHGFSCPTQSPIDDGVANRLGDWTATVRLRETRSNLPRPLQTILHVGMGRGAIAQ